MNRLVDASRVKRITHIKNPTGTPNYSSTFPTSGNWIADDIRGVIAFVPVDDENSILYGRYYQRIITLPVLHSLMGFFGRIGSRVIACQDKRVVTRIIPKDPAETDSEHLRVSDLGVIKYRKRKKEPQTAAQASE